MSAGADRLETTLLGGEGGTLPPAAAAAALDDQCWFGARLGRRFRARAGDGGVWFIRRRPQGDADVYMRTWSRADPCRDDDGELAALWYAAAYPDGTSEQVQKGAPQSRIAAMTSPAKLIALYSFNGLLATKRIRLNPKTGKLVKTDYGRESHFTVKEVELSGFGHLCKCLDTLTQRRTALVVRGEPLPDTNREKTRRLFHYDPATGEPATFAEAARSWFAIDIDKVKKPVLIDPVTDPEGVIEYLIGLLPPEMHDASCWWHFTCSQSLPGCEDTLSARLWFWLYKPQDDAALTRWARSANKAFGSKLIDDSIYRPVQPHYTANPIFDGMPDPLPRRHGVRVGLDEAVSLVIPEPSVDDPYVAGEGYVGLGVEGHLAEIGGERGFRAPMVSAIAAYITANGGDADPELIKARVREAIAAAPCGGRSDADIARYCSDRHLNDIIGWVRARERANPRAKMRATLQMLAGVVPVDGERGAALRKIGSALVRAFSVPPELALCLLECWNEQHCTPPLPREQVSAIFNALALNEASRLGGRRARR